MENRRVLTRELERVAVAARDEHVATARLLVRDRRGEKVVRLVARCLRAREPKCGAERRQQRELLDDRILELASRLVRGEGLVPVGRNLERVPRDEDGART